jgi:hypothetical protein
MKRAKVKRFFHTGTTHEYMATHYVAECGEGVCTCMSKITLSRRPIPRIKTEVIGKATVKIINLMSLNDNPFLCNNYEYHDFYYFRTNDRPHRTPEEMEKATIRLLQAAIQYDEVAANQPRPSLKSLDFKFEVQGMLVSPEYIGDFLASLVSGESDDTKIVDFIAEKNKKKFLN